MSPYIIALDMHSLAEWVMTAIVGKALAQRHEKPQPGRWTGQVHRQRSEREPTKSHDRWQSQNEVGQTHHFERGQSPPINIPNAKKCPAFQRSAQHLSRLNLKAPTTGPIPKLEMPFPEFRNMSSHHAEPGLEMDYISLPERPESPPVVTALEYKSQNETQGDKDAEIQTLLKGRAIRKWRIQRTGRFPPPRFTPPPAYPYTTEDFRDANDFDKIVFPALDEKIPTKWWSNDIISLMVSPKDNMPSRNNPELSMRPRFFRVKAAQDLAPWKTTKQKQVQWAPELERPQRQEHETFQKLDRKGHQFSAEPCLPKELQYGRPVVGKPSSTGARALEAAVRHKGPTEDSHEYLEEGRDDAEETDDDSDYYAASSPDLYISTEEASWSSKEGEAQCTKGN